MEEKAEHQVKNIDGYVEEDSYLGSGVLHAMKRRGITQKELAAAIGIHTVTLNKIIKGVQSTKVDTLLKLCKELKVTPNFLIGPGLYEFENRSKRDIQIFAELLSELSVDEINDFYQIVRKRRM